LAGKAILLNLHQVHAKSVEQRNVLKALLGGNGNICHMPMIQVEWAKVRRDIMLALKTKDPMVIERV
jgi:hypothetical protein